MPLQALKGHRRQSVCWNIIDRQCIRENLALGPSQEACVTLGVWFLDTSWWRHLMQELQAAVQCSGQPTLLTLGDLVEM